MKQSQWLRASSIVRLLGGLRNTAAFRSLLAWTALAVFQAALGAADRCDQRPLRRQTAIALNAAGSPKFAGPGRLLFGMQLSYRARHNRSSGK